MTGELIRLNPNPQGFGRNDGADVTAKRPRRCPTPSVRVSPLNEILPVSHLAVPQAQDVPSGPGIAGLDKTKQTVIKRK